MSFDWERIREGKRALRRNLASRPIAEKLRMLDALRERELAIRGQGAGVELTELHEDPAPYRARTIERP